MAKSRFSHITESPTKEHIVRLMESEEARKLLQEALAKSGELVASLEEKLKESQASDQRARKWFNDEREETQRLRMRIIDVEGRLDGEAGRTAKALYERDHFRERLNRALGWIDHAQGKPPEVTVPEAGPGWDRDGGRLG